MPDDHKKTTPPPTVNAGITFEEGKTFLYESERTKPAWMKKGPGFGDDDLREGSPYRYFLEHGTEMPLDARLEWSRKTMPAGIEKITPGQWQVIFEVLEEHRPKHRKFPDAEPLSGHEGGAQHQSRDSRPVSDIAPGDETKLGQRFNIPDLGTGNSPALPTNGNLSQLLKTLPNADAIVGAAQPLADTIGNTRQNHTAEHDGSKPITHAGLVDKGGKFIG